MSDSSPEATLMCFTDTGWHLLPEVRDMLQCCLNASSFQFKFTLSTVLLSQKNKAKLQAISYCLEQELATGSVERKPWDYLQQHCIQLIFAQKGFAPKRFLPQLNFCCIYLPVLFFLINKEPLMDLNRKSQIILSKKICIYLLIIFISLLNNQESDLFLAT